jgi:hypothetical protein
MQIFVLIRMVSWDVSGPLRCLYAKASADCIYARIFRYLLESKSPMAIRQVNPVAGVPSGKPDDWFSDES